MSSSVEAPDVNLDEDLANLVQTGHLDQWKAISFQALRNTELLIDKTNGGGTTDKDVPLTIKARPRRVSL